MKISAAMTMPFWMNLASNFDTMVVLLCHRHHQECRRRGIGALGLTTAVRNGLNATVIGQGIGGIKHQILTMTVGQISLDPKREATPRTTRFLLPKIVTGPHVVPVAVIMESVHAALTD